MGTSVIPGVARGNAQEYPSGVNAGTGTGDISVSNSGDNPWIGYLLGAAPAALCD